MEFNIEDIDGCEFVKNKSAGHMLISFDTDEMGYRTGKIRTVYADGSGGAIDQEEAQEHINSGYWKVIR